MRKAFLFTPSCDAALGAGDPPAYTLPKGARPLEEAGAPLPWVLACRDDLVLVPGGMLSSPQFEAWHKGVSQRFGPLPIFADTIPRGEAFEPAPWGWSRSTARRLRGLGAEASAIPDRETLERRRRLAHRRSALTINGGLRQALPNALFPPMAVEARSWEEVAQALRERGDAVIKSPWSSSGRGVFRASAVTPQIVEGLIRRQGSVMVETRLERIQDFAMLFDYAEGRARFTGYSLFMTDDAGSYRGNILASDTWIEGWLGRWVATALLRAVRQVLEDELARLLREEYRGLLGVDMMVWLDNATKSPALAPCVEMNLRPTMGHISHALGARLSVDAPHSVMHVGCQGKGGGLRLVPENPYFDISVRSLKSSGLSS